VWQKDDLLQHKNTWKPETKEGEQGVTQHIEKRKAGQI
jgi:hypothetical protein